jgi:MSHA biogenesis protein MshM
MKGITYALIKKSMGEKKKRVLLCIDEAQSMPLETLEMMRLLTNLESEKKKLLQVVLFGQPELDEKLAHHSIRQLKQRITFSYRLQPLDRHGIAAYITHRLLTAGSSGAIQFHPGAFKLLEKGSRGYPRLVNILAHKALILGFGQGTMIITSQHIKAAIKDTEGAFKPRFWLW